MTFYIPINILRICFYAITVYFQIFIYDYIMLSMLEGLQGTIAYDFFLLKDSQLSTWCDLMGSVRSSYAKSPSTT